MRLWSGRGRARVRKAGAALVSQLPAYVGLFWRLLIDRRVPRGARALVAAAGLYVLLPIDLIPDFLGILGLTDDIFLLALALRRLVVSAGDEVVRSNWRGSPGGLDLLHDAVDELGDVLPGPVRKALNAYVDRW